MIQEDRALWKYILFGFLTCGIYNYYFIYKMAQDVNVMCADDGKKTSGLVAFVLLSYLTCGIYTLIWYYSLANRLEANAPRYGLHFQENGTTVLMWHIFGMLLCGIGAYIAMHIMIKNTNEMAKAYNRQGYTGTTGTKRVQQPIKSFPQEPKVQYIEEDHSPNPYAEKETTVLYKSQETHTSKAILYFVQSQETVTIDKDDFKIGKNAGMVDYVIGNSTMISRQHAVIQCRNGQYYVTDMQSTNGTFVNGNQIIGTVQLQDGDNIRYADVISVFNILK